MSADPPEPADRPEIPGDVLAVVLTFRRVRLASQVVRALVEQEGFAPSQILVVVNGEGGLDDPALEREVHMVRLPRNVGPAGGFRAGLIEARRLGATWAYLCEDDIGLFDLPTPRVARLVQHVEASPRAKSIGAVVAYGRRLDPKTGRTVPVVPDPGVDLIAVDTAAWGASLVRCRLVDDAILPDPDFFFGFEDFDFWFAMQRAGYRLLLDVPTASLVASRVFHERRTESLRAQRPVDADEPWRRYYEARNFLELRRRYGRSSWTRSHVLLTARRAQLSPTWAHRRAALHGLLDGLRGRLGQHPRHNRGLGEHPDRAGDGCPGAVLQVITDNDRRGGQVFAADLHEALATRGVRVRTVALGPATSDVALDFEVLGPTRRHPQTLRALHAAMRENDVVIAHGSTTLPMCALAGWTTGKPFVYRQISEQRFWANTTARRLRTRVALRAAEQVVALWPGAAATLIDVFGVEPERVTVIPNGVPRDRVPVVDQQRRVDARRRFRLDVERATLVSIGALVAEKGVDVLVRAMAEPDLDDWQLLVVGAGPERERLEQLAARLRLDRVRFQDAVSSGHDALAAGDVVALASRGGDSMPAVLIEAGMMGIPAVATPIEGIVEIVKDGRTGALIDVDDPPGLATAVASVHERRQELSAAARDHCLARFEIEVVAAQWLELLRAIGPVDDRRK